MNSLETKGAELCIICLTNAHGQNLSFTTALHIRLLEKKGLEKNLLFSRELINC